jgi:hypothetical protein
VVFYDFVLDFDSSVITHEFTKPNTAQWTIRDKKPAISRFFNKVIMEK